jgi:O-antigen/teichoic acid export membrane protein
MVVVPVCLLVSGFAGEVFALLLDVSWAPAAVYLALMALATMFIPLHVMNLTVNKVLGRVDWLLRIEVTKKLLAIAVLAVSARWGVLGIVVGQLGMAIASVFINGVYASRGVGIALHRQILMFLPYLLIGILALATGTAFAEFSGLDGWSGVAVSSILVLALFLGTNKTLGTEGFVYAERLLLQNRT